MDVIWQWMWDRFATSYAWALCALAFVVSLPIYATFVSLPIVALEGSDRYAAVLAITVIAVVILVGIIAMPVWPFIVSIQKWAAGADVHPQTALEHTYRYTRVATPRTVWGTGVWAATLAVVVGTVAGATVPRLLQYAVIGAVIGVTVQIVAFHSIVEAAMRPARVAIIGALDLGDGLPQPRPTFAARSNASMIAIALAGFVGGALVAAVFHQVRTTPILVVVIGGALTVAFAVPISVGIGFSASLRPIRDLTEAAERVANGDYRGRLPVVQDDDLGVLAASFNRMQAGLAERQRLQAAFGTYVDPALAARLLQQGDDVFTGERREVTVMFVDIRDFTPFAESHSAEETVARLNALFDIVVPAVVENGGHVNKFLGDGALAVFGAPNDLPGHADAAVAAAAAIGRSVAQRFGGELRIGIGINTGSVIAGTIGGAAKLEFTLIGDAVNVAARVEQLTKLTGDVTLLTQQTVDALATRPVGLEDRGSHALKGKSDAVRVYAVR